LVRDVMIWIIEVLTSEAYLIRVYIIKSTIIAIIMRSSKTVAVSCEGCV